MSFRFLRCFFLLPLLGTGLLACQPEQPAETPAGPATAPALADSLNYDSLDTPLAATPMKRDWHRVERPTARRAPLVVYRSSRPPQDETPPPPAEPRLQDLTLRPSEYFKIDPTKAAEVRGQEGTVVRFPAGALVDARQQPVTGTVWVELKECYSGPSMLLSNLLTETESGRPLELSGAVLVRASAQGRPLALATGRNFQLELKGRTRETPLFYGQGGPDGVVRWAAGEAAPAASQVLTTAQRMPRYGQDIADFNKLIRYPRQAQENQTEGVVFASFVVDESGRIQQPRILRGLGNGCDEEVLRVLRQTSGRWTPGQQDGRFVKVKMMLPIRFKFQPGQATAPDAPEPAAPIEVADVDETEEDSGLAAAPNSLQPSRLGWLAAGRAWVGKAAPLFVPAFVANAETAVRLLVPGRRVVLAAAPQQGGYQFMNAPTGATVVGLRYENGAPFLARQPTPAGAPPDTLRFQETTLAELETALSKLN
ncbi:energy transducer TonB [Hymenobacter psychrophilus]|uniref:TonB family C-terminal domain-containing protein n=1 Tax=Hymenobacter psychrophilus TaxID=651662 RepID=A0A1H3HJV5_9BACT|nr:energy transducer TonB [Hymenobacter psychrophilus]SDY15078.1 TonB family C-terminal domain-containing protein [Hymenobacter psychrophilus]